MVKPLENMKNTTRVCRGRLEIELKSKSGLRLIFVKISSYYFEYSFLIQYPFDSIRVAYQIYFKYLQFYFMSFF